MMHLRRAWRQWKNMCRQDYDKGMKLMEGHAMGFRNGRGVLYKNVQAIDVSAAELWFVPNRGPGCRDVGTSGGTVWEKGDDGQYKEVAREGRE